MTGSDYTADVVASLREDGWSTSPTTVGKNAVVIRARRDGDPGRLLVMVVDDPDGEISSKHVRYLVNLAREKGADAAWLSTPGRITDDAARLADEHGVDVLDAEAVRTATTAPSPSKSRAAATGGGEDERGGRSLANRIAGRGAGPLLVIAVVVLLAVGGVVASGAAGTFGVGFRDVHLLGPADDSAALATPSRTPTPETHIAEVPRVADWVVALDGSAVLDGAGPIVEAATEIPGLSRAIDRLEAVPGVDPRDVESVTVYAARRTELSYAAVHVVPANGGPNRTVLERATRRDGHEVTYRNETAFALPAPRKPTLWYVELADGTYLYGTKPAVQDGVDVALGDGETLSAAVESALANARTAPVTFAYAPDGSLRSSELPGVGWVVGTATAREGRVSVSVSANATSELAAVPVAEEVRARVDDWLRQDTRAESALRNVSVRLNGSRVTLSTTGFPGAVGTLARIVVDVSGVLQHRARAVAAGS